MNLDDRVNEAVRELGDAVNSAIETSLRVSEAIKRLRELGFEPTLPFRFGIGLNKIEENFEEQFNNFEPEDIELSLTDEDLKTLHRMKIRLDSE